MTNVGSCKLASDCFGGAFYGTATQSVAGPAERASEVGPPVRMATSASFDLGQVFAVPFWGLQDNHRPDGPLAVTALPRRLLDGADVV